MSLFFEDFEVGMRFETPSRTVTETDVVNFAYLSGDWSPLHTDEEFAKKTEFGGRIAHGMLTLSIISGLHVRLKLTEDTIIAFYGLDKLRFIKPVYIGDTLRAEIEVVEKEDRDGYGLVTYKVNVLNQKNEVVVKYLCKVAVKKAGRECEERK
jgi:acyl dehydratase